MGKIKVAAVGGGGCSTLVQGVQDYLAASEIVRKSFYEFIPRKQDR